VTITETSSTFGIKGAEVDMIAEVYKVVDGDTFDAFPSGRVRLADVNTPEVGGAGLQRGERCFNQLAPKQESLPRHRRLIRDG